MSDLAMALALCGDDDKLSQAVALCERVLTNNQADKVHHTTRAALCFIYLKGGKRDKAIEHAHSLQHLRESRENVLAHLDRDPSDADINAYLTFFAIGESIDQYIIEISVGVNMTAVCTEHDLPGKIRSLREEINALGTNGSYHKLPLIQIHDKAALAPNQVQVRRYAEYLLDKAFDNHLIAVNEILAVLRAIAMG